MFGQRNIPGSNETILNSRHYGFRKNKGTIDAVSMVTQTIIESLDKSQKTLGLFCDLSKAFDCVDHNILLCKLKHYGLSDIALRLINSYISDRYHTTLVNGVYSDKLRLKCGVPQGSILGPFLFNIYVNDMPSCLKEKGTVVMYADDTAVVFSQKNMDQLATLVNESVGVLSDWFNANKLLFNVGKTKAVLFSLSSQNSNCGSLNIKYNDKDVHLVNNIKFLGIHIDSKLKWDGHINNLTPKLSSAVFAISKIRSFCGLAAAKQVYFAYFHSLMSYGIKVWGSAATAGKIFILQKRAIRAVLALPPLASCRSSFKKHRIMTFHSEYVFHNILHAVSNISNTPLIGSWHNYSTRNKDKISFPKCRLTKKSKSFICNSIRFYNSIKKNICVNDKVSPLKFKHKLKKLLITMELYSTKDINTK